MRPRPVLTPTFRSRLRLFFFVIVVLPMVAVALVLFRLVSTSQDAEIDAKLAQAQRSAAGFYTNTTDDAAVSARTIGSNSLLAAAIRDNDSAKIQSRLAKLASTTGARR